MGTEFNLPDSPPPGNTFPLATNPGAQRASIVTLSKGQPRAIVVEVKEDRSPRSSEEGELRTAPETPQPGYEHYIRPNESLPLSMLEPRDEAAPTSTAAARSEATATPTPDQTIRSRQHPNLTIQTSPPQGNPQGSHSQASSMTLNENGNDGAAPVEETDQTPVMRSMFPRFDPEVRMSRQNYIPPVDLLPPPPPLLPGMRSSRPSSQVSYVPAQHSPMHSPWLGSQRAMSPAPVMQTLERAEQELSASEELLDLWTIANGQLCPEAKETYFMGLECDSLTHDHEAMQFTSSTSAVYRLHASGSTVVITRAHPMNEGTEINISAPLIHKPSTTSPLLASIFPSLAELLALDQASNVAISNNLTRQESTSLQAEALQRARSSEAASLLWDSDSSAYFFTIPALVNPTAPLPQALAITIVPGKSIVFQDPARRSLLSLNLHEAVLTVHTTAIVELSSSLYTLDLLISTLLNLLLHLHRHTALLTPYAAPVTVPHFDPPPRVAIASSNPGSPRSASRMSRRSKASQPTPASSSKLNRWLSRSTAGAASEHAVAVRSPLSTYSSPYLGSPTTKDLEAALSATTLHPSMSNPNPTLAQNLPDIPAHGVAPELRKETTGVDLSRFQAYDLSDPALGKGTRAMLRVLYWAFGVLVWVLGVGVGVIAAILVGLGGCFSGKKEGRIDGGREG